MSSNDKAVVCIVAALVAALVAMLAMTSYAHYLDNNVLLECIKATSDPVKCKAIQ